jgi:hypothetical protein
LRPGPIALYNQRENKPHGVEGLIKRTLADIIGGVEEAQRTNSTTAIINLQVASSHGANREVLTENRVLWDSSDYSMIEQVHFDVAVTAEEGNKSARPTSPVVDVTHVR